MDLYKEIFKKNDNAVLILDKEFIFECNKSMYELWGKCSEHSLINKTLESVFKEYGEALNKDFLDKLESFNRSFLSIETNLEFSLYITTNKTFYADVIFYKLPKYGSETEYYTVVTIKPQKSILYRIESIQLGSQNIDLTINSLLQFIKQLFNNSSVGIAIKGLTTNKIIAINDTFIEPLKYGRDELIGSSFDDITPSEYLSLDKLGIESLLKTGSCSTYKKEYTCKDNSRITVKSYSGIIINGIEENFIWSFVENITDCENIKISLKNELNLMDVASQQTNTGVWQLDIISGYLKWSDEIYRIFEIDKENFVASYDTFLATIHPADRDSVNDAYQKSLIDKNPYQITHRLQMPDGRIKIVSERCTTSFNEAGIPLVSVGTVQDITCANNSRIELERSPILDASRDFIGVADLEGRITFINQAGCDMMGVHPDFDKEGWMIHHLYDETDQELLAKEMMPALKTSGIWKGDLKLKNRLNENCIIVDCDAFRVDDPKTGEPICFATVSQNITIRKAAELELQAYKESLEQIVRERTIAFQEANLKAVQANKAKSIFLSRMSHELRTPLNAVLGFSQLIKDELLPNDRAQHDNIDEVLVAGGHLLNLINDILEISLIESGRINIQNTDVNLGKSIQQSIKSLSSSIIKKDIALTSDLKDDVYIKGDLTRIFQVLANVLSNAIKFNKQHGTIEISLNQSKSNAVLIAVRDTGSGIEERKLARILDPFERVDYDVYEGSGIGLALVKELMNLMGGTVRIKSVVGRGTTVLLEFIASNIENKNTLVKYAKIPLLNVSGNIKILYIEDVSANMRLMRRMLVKLGDITLLEAKSGELGINSAKDNIPMIILLDINLPDMNGFDVLKVLKSDNKTKDIPIIAVSANAFPDDIECALKQGFDDYITKPFDYDQLLRKVSSFIEIE